MARTRDETIRRARLGDIRRLLHYRYGPTLPDDDAVALVDRIRGCFGS